MKKVSFGWVEGVEVFKYTLTNGTLEADIITYGSTVTSIRFPDKNGSPTEVALGWQTLEEYQTKPGYLGAIVGRFGNRIENARFTLNGVEYQVGANEAPHSLHGGFHGFDKKIWEATPVGEDTLICHYLSPDGEEGFPGNLDVTVTYSVSAENGLVIEYQAVSDCDTIVNLTNHSYFNLSGAGSSTDELLLQILADRITPTDEKLIPHNEYRSVENTVYDFRTASPFIKDISSVPILKARGCYDTNYVLCGDGFRKVAGLYSPVTGIGMDVYTDQPGIQIYTGNKKGIAMETQNFPNAVNCPDYPSCVLPAGACYSTKTAYCFSVK